MKLSLLIAYSRGGTRTRDPGIMRNAHPGEAGCAPRVGPRRSAPPCATREPIVVANVVTRDTSVFARHFGSPLCLVGRFGWLLLAVALVGCESQRTLPDGTTARCIGVNEQGHASLQYELSTRNLIVGALFVEMIAPPLVVLLKEISCPIGRKPAAVKP